MKNDMKQDLLAKLTSKDDKANCPCKKKNCVRHGNCEECRKYHAESKRQRPCDRKHIFNANSNLQPEATIGDEQ